jgi:uncharacterized membrane protein YheB (UPF0754 family)
MELLIVENNYWFFLLPIVTAVLGWIIHSLAIYFFINNILPRKKTIIAEKIGEAAAKEFTGFAGLEEKINDPRQLESILPTIESHIDHFLNEKLKQEMPFIGMFIGNKTTDKLKEVFMGEIKSLFPEVIGQFAGNLKASINVKEIITNKINAITAAEFGQLIRSHLSSELKYLRLLGAVQGFMIGIFILLFTVLTS